jgi:hypothetical protein
MAAGQPLSSLALGAGSVADDLGYVALADLSYVMGKDVADYRVIGGHTITILAARWGLGSDLYRETGDVDLGIPPVVARDHRLVDRLIARGYDQVEGNRFARTMPATPTKVAGRHAAPQQAIIDVLVPAYTGRARQNVKVSENLVSTEVPGLADALARPPVIMTLELRRLNGEVLQATLPFTDEVSALVLKSLATRVRIKDTDIADIWRCLEIAFTAGCTPSDFTRGARSEAAAIVRDLFARRQGPAMTALATEQRLSVQAADQRFTRIRALSTRILGPPTAGSG